MNPETGIFTQEDTYQGNIYDAISLHKYLYAAANPVAYTDPSGNMFTLAEAAVSVGSHAVQAFISVWSAMKALKILKCVSILADVCDITTSVISITTMPKCCIRIIIWGKEKWKS